jgi:hypothetical protein
MGNTVYPAHWLNILNGATATNSAPSGATAGVAVPQNLRGENVTARFRHSTTAGNDARTFTVKLWGYCPGEVDSDGDAISSTAGWCDTEETYSLASVSADGSISKRFVGLTAFSRLYAEVTAISGTGTAVSVAVGLNSEM